MYIAYEELSQILLIYLMNWLIINHYLMRFIRLYRGDLLLLHIIFFLFLFIISEKAKFVVILFFFLSFIRTIFYLRLIALFSILFFVIRIIMIAHTSNLQTDYLARITESFHWRFVFIDWLIMHPRQFLIDIRYKIFLFLLFIIIIIII